MEMRSFVSIRERGACGGQAVRSCISGGDAQKVEYEFRRVRKACSSSFHEMEEVRRFVMMMMRRGAKWVSKQGLLPCVMVFALLTFWALTFLSYYYSSGSIFSSMSRTDYQNQAAYQNLDNISIALLKLGLPLSAYALSMQNSRAHSNSSSPNHTTLAAHITPSMTSQTADRQASGGHRLPVRTVNESKVDGSLNLMTGDSSKMNVSASEFSMYSVASPYKYEQQLWVFHNVCYNGSHLIRLRSEQEGGEGKWCKEPEDAAPHGILTPIHCRDENQYVRGWAMVGKETGIPTAERAASWISSRGSSILWRNETVAVLNLDGRATDPARFLQKVNSLLLLNNASTAVQGFSDRVHTLMLMSHHRVAKRLEHHPETFHRSYLTTILSRASSTNEKVVDDILQTKSAAADSRILLNDPFSAATEKGPLCFHKAVLTGNLKGSCWPGGEIVADVVRNHLIKKFDTKMVSRASNIWPCIVPILGNNTRRTLTSTSEQVFWTLLNKKSLGLEVHSRDFYVMNFKQQFHVLQMADIVTGFYGPDLMVPATFCRKTTILVEIFPFKVRDRAHEIQALDSGLIYMAHQCQEGIQQNGDSVFQNQSASDCMINSKCKQYYATVRKVKLTDESVSQLQKLFSLARLITSETRAQKLTKRRDIHNTSPFLVEKLIGGRRNCRPFTRTVVPSASCGDSWISFMIESHGPMTCCYQWTS